MNEIRSVYGPEPMRPGEFPIAHVVGFDGVTSITKIEENLGTYGIQWFCIWHGERETCRLNALHVAQVDFAKEISDAL
jgi:hypothetical protein